MFIILDPLCVVKNVTENIDLFDHSPGAILALTKCGSHLPFFDIFMRNWAEKATYEFFDSTLKNY